MSENYALDVQVDSIPIDKDGLRVDHPRLKEYMVNGFKMGWNNERIIQITGLPASVVSEGRSKWEKERKAQTKN